MSINWKRGLLLGVSIFLYSIAAQNFWPDLNNWLNALFGAMIGIISYKISEILFEEE